jgi:dGTPase
MGIPQTDRNPLGYARYPLVYLVEAADDICYQLMDIDDAHKLGIIPTEQVKQLFMGFFNTTKDHSWITSINQTLADVTDKNEQVAFLRSMAIGKLTQECSNAFIRSYHDIMLGKPVAALIKQLDNTEEAALKEIQKISIEQVYNHPTVIEIELAGYKILSTLLEKICPALLFPNDGYNRKVLRLIPKQYVTPNVTPYQSLMAAVDFVSGMHLRCTEPLRGSPSPA